MSELLPWLHKKRTRIINLETVDEQAIPESPGVYLMLSKNTEYPYPRSKSRVFYIGQSVDLRERIWNTHRKFYLEARDERDPEYNYYWQRYEYAASHGCKITWITCRSTQSAKRLEKKLLTDFAKYYRAIPVANGQGAW